MSTLISEEMQTLLKDDEKVGALYSKIVDKDKRLNVLWLLSELNRSITKYRKKIHYEPPGTLTNTIMTVQLRTLEQVRDCLLNSGQKQEL